MNVYLATVIHYQLIKKQVYISVLLDFFFCNKHDQKQPEKQTYSPSLREGTQGSNLEAGTIVVAMRNTVYWLPLCGLPG